VVLVTGSKFFEGPPFCGAALFPLSMMHEIEVHIQANKGDVMCGCTRCHVWVYKMSCVGVKMSCVGVQDVMCGCTRVIAHSFPIHPLISRS
jgi:hypothetical protein